MSQLSLSPANRKPCAAPGLNSATQAATPITMTSLQLVEYINEQRAPGVATLAHNDFLKKVPQVLGAGGLGNFSSTYIHPQNRQQYPMYVFPKREACLMAMSYSYDLQAKVYDRMTALEEQNRAPALPNFGNPAEAARAWAVQYEVAQQAQAQLVHTTKALEVAEPKARALDLLINDSKRSVGSIARQLPGVNSRAIKNDLQWKYLYKQGGQWKVYRNGHADKFFYEGSSDAYGKWDIFCTEAGQVEMVRLADAGMLTMKTTSRAVKGGKASAW